MRMTLLTHVICAWQQSSQYTHPNESDWSLVQHGHVGHGALPVARAYEISEPE